MNIRDRKATLDAHRAKLTAESARIQGEIKYLEQAYMDLYDSCPHSECTCRTYFTPHDPTEHVLNCLEV